MLLEKLGFLTSNDVSFRISKTDIMPAQSVFVIGNEIVVYNKLENKPEQQMEILVFTKIGQELL